MQREYKQAEDKFFLPDSCWECPFCFAGTLLSAWRTWLLGTAGSVYRWTESKEESRGKQNPGRTTWKTSNSTSSKNTQTHTHQVCWRAGVHLFSILLRVLLVTPVGRHGIEDKSCWCRRNFAGLVMLPINSEWVRTELLCKIRQRVYTFSCNHLMVKAEATKGRENKRGSTHLLLS